MIEQEIAIPTKAGAVDTFICHPERGGPWPVILFLMDAPGMREELRDMARRFATVGYTCCCPISITGTAKAWWSTPVPSPRTARSGSACSR